MWCLLLVNNPKQWQCRWYWTKMSPTLHWYKVFWYIFNTFYASWRFHFLASYFSFPGVCELHFLGIPSLQGNPDWKVWNCNISVGQQIDLCLHRIIISSAKQKNYKQSKLLHPSCLGFLLLLLFSQVHFQMTAFK